MKTLTIWMSLFLAIAPVTAHGLDKSVPLNNKPWIRMEREACYGFCPVYQLEIFYDGSVQFYGEKFILQTGEQSALLSDEQLAALKALIEQSAFLQLNENCCSCMEMTDMPTVNIEIFDGTSYKKIKHYHGCTKAPEWLGNLEDQIDELSGTIQWVGTAKQREGYKWR